MSRRLPMRDVTPYGSIRLQVPADWNEDTMASDLCVYYYPGAAGPPMLYVRRDDFVYDKSAAALIPGQKVEGSVEAPTDTTEADEELFSRFRLLAASLDVPDLYFPSVEPRSTKGQIIRYRRLGMIDKQPGAAWWWVKAARVGDTFAVMSCSMEVYAKDVDMAPTKAAVDALDLAVSRAELLSLDDALAEHERKTAEEDAAAAAAAAPAAEAKAPAKKTAAG